MGDIPKIKLLTFEDEWTYTANFRSERDALIHIDKEGYDYRRCKIEYVSTNEMIRVDKLIEMKKQSSAFSENCQFCGAFRSLKVVEPCMKCGEYPDDNASDQNYY